MAAAKPSQPSTASSPKGKITPDSAIRTLQDEKSKFNWIITGVSTPGKLDLVSYGTGGVAELAKKLDPSEVNFVAIRVIQVFERIRGQELVGMLYAGEKASWSKKELFGSVQEELDRVSTPVAIMVEYSSDFSLKTIAKALLEQSQGEKPISFECAGEKVLAKEL